MEWLEGEDLAAVLARRRRRARREPRPGAAQDGGRAYSLPRTRAGSSTPTSSPATSSSSPVTSASSSSSTSGSRAPTGKSRRLTTRAASSGRRGTIRAAREQSRAGARSTRGRTCSRSRASTHECVAGRTGLRGGRTSWRRSPSSCFQQTPPAARRPRGRPGAAGAPHGPDDGEEPEESAARLRRRRGRSSPHIAEVLDAWASPRPATLASPRDATMRSARPRWLPHAQRAAARVPRCSPARRGRRADERRGGRRRCPAPRTSRAACCPGALERGPERSAVQLSGRCGPRWIPRRPHHGDLARFTRRSSPARERRGPGRSGRRGARSRCARGSSASTFAVATGRRGCRRRSSSRSNT